MLFLSIFVILSLFVAILQFSLLIILDLRTSISIYSQQTPLLPSLKQFSANL